MDTIPLNVTATAAGSTYDETPYPSTSFPQTHVDKLCAMGRLFGLNAADPARARVLELGCANGANLLPMAQHAPEARFLGIDASSKQISTGQAAIDAVKLTNVELRHQNILEFPATEGKFDYIIVHGIFSWVPDAVRDKILAICRDHLSETGVAYISYNAFPGWGMRMALRDMMLFHTRGFAEPASKVQQARALTAFLADAVPETAAFGMLVKQELERMKSQADNYLRHDILEETNQPFYFHQFMQRAGSAGLQYLSETSLDQMLASNFPEKVVQTLEKVGSNIVAKEQYMDFVRNRNFRQTLLCHQNVSLNRALSADSIKKFYYTSLIAKPETGSVDLNPGVAHDFKMRTSDLVVTADHPFTKAIFATLADCGLKRISYDELLEAARAKSAEFTDEKWAANRSAAEEATLGANLIRLYSRGVIDIFADRPHFRSSVPKKPSLTPLARYQAMNSQFLTNLAHQVHQFDLIGRYVMAACDGSRDYEGIVDSLVELVNEGKLHVAENGKSIEDKDRIRVILMDQTKTYLVRLTALGYFQNSASD